jgi:hypothetical protein
MKYPEHPVQDRRGIDKILKRFLNLGESESEPPITVYRVFSQLYMVG